MVIISGIREWIEGSLKLALAAGVALVLVVMIAFMVFSPSQGQGDSSDAEAAEGFSFGDAVAEEPQADLDLPVESTQEVEEFLQYPNGYSAGCEPISLTIALRSLGFDITVDELFENYVTFDESWTDPSCYLGSPYEQGVALPQGIVNIANAYLQGQGSDMIAVDATGSAFEELLSLAESGVPVVIWTTMYGNEPHFSGESVGGVPWYLNEHCVVMYGVEGDEVLISDPLSGLINRTASDFGWVYEQCGSMAVFIIG